MTWLSCFGGGRRTVTVEILFPDSSKLTVDYSVSFRILIGQPIRELELCFRGLHELDS